MSKQAVLLIHGIGEQRPMDTLRGFVETVWTTDASRQRQHGAAASGLWSKPYTLSENFELRRLTSAENRAGIKTDYFEFYWAHLMQGTKVSHVVSWALDLLVRNPRTVPKQLRLAYWFLVALVALGLYVAFALAMTKGAGPSAIPSWLSWAYGLAVAPLILFVVQAIVGDAARYLHVAPPNVQTRHQIRSAGAQVLRSLHERGYDRIVVVGHSLGTVIGYDVLNHSWTEFNQDEPKQVPPASFDALEALEAMAASLRDGGEESIDDIQVTQRRYLEELKANGNRWRVTDFITLGSPLAHADILLAHERKGLVRRFSDREFPVCPPFLEDSVLHGRKVSRFSYDSGKGGRVPHHAAVFGPTRWTNLFFPQTFLVHGDLVGGPVSPVFGAGVRDVPVKTGRWFGLLSHTFYWKPGKAKDSHVEALRAALDLLDEGRLASPPAAPDISKQGVAP